MGDIIHITALVFVYRKLFAPSPENNIDTKGYEIKINQATIACMIMMTDTFNHIVAKSSNLTYF